MIPSRASPRAKNFRLFFYARDNIIYTEKRRTGGKRGGKGRKSKFFSKRENAFHFRQNLPKKAKFLRKKFKKPRKIV